MEKYPSQSFTNTAGAYTFSGTLVQTALQGITPSQGSTGFNFASFLTGGMSNVLLAAPTDSQCQQAAVGLVRAG